MKSRNLILLVLFALLITPVLAVAPTSNFYLVPTDMKVYSMVPYDAMVYQDGTYTIAVNRTGGIINATLTSAHTDDIPIQAAINYSAGGKLDIGKADYHTSHPLIFSYPTFPRTVSGVGALAWDDQSWSSNNIGTVIIADYTDNPVIRIGGYGSTAGLTFEYICFKAKETALTNTQNIIDVNSGAYLLTFRGCDFIHSHWTDGAVTNSGNGIYLNSSGFGVTIENCRIAYAGAWGIYDNLDSGPLTLKGNMIHHCGNLQTLSDPPVGGGIRLGSVSPLKAANAVSLVGNTITYNHVGLYAEYGFNINVNNGNVFETNDYDGIILGSASTGGSNKVYVVDITGNYFDTNDYYHNVAANVSDIAIRNTGGVRINSNWFNNPYVNFSVYNAGMEISKPQGNAFSGITTAYGGNLTGFNGTVYDRLLP